ncbi:MAG: DUF2062 domain-containing protein [Desulfomonile tiedjei]|nr:DUF2062 domain-containing protein [Desulfomonile tiedjei]
MNDRVNETPRPGESTRREPEAAAAVQGDTVAERAPRRGRGLITWCRESLYETMVKPFVTSKHPPWYDARAVALGFFVGFAFPMGTHLTSLVVLRSLLRFNYLLAAGVTLVCNPLDIIPLYYGFYVLGSRVLGETTTLDIAAVESLINPVMSKTYFWEAFTSFTQIGREFLVRWFVGGTIVGLVSAVPGYFITLEVQKRRCEKAARQLNMTYEQLLERLDSEADGKGPRDS